MLRKFWINITKDEQKQPLRGARRRTSTTSAWKLTDEDWRNREKWAAYEEAANDMLRLTNTENAPWVIVEGNDKRFARIKTIHAVCEALDKRISEVAERAGPT